MVAFAQYAWLSNLFSRERRGLWVQLAVTGKWDLLGCWGLPDLLGHQGRMETR